MVSGTVQVHGALADAEHAMCHDGKESATGFNHRMAHLLVIATVYAIDLRSWATSPSRQPGMSRTGSLASAAAGSSRPSPHHGMKAVVPAGRSLVLQAEAWSHAE